MRLIIFDLDQTLVDVFPFHNKATELTFKKVFNVDARMDEIDFSGKTIKKVLIELATLKKIPKSEKNKKISIALKTYDKNFISILPKNIKKFVLPGVYPLINGLAKDKNNFLIVLTGDSKKIAKTLLQRAALLKKFHFLITGEHTTNRIKLMKIAVKRAHKEAKQKKFEKIIVIGDSIHDIEAGKAVKALTIAVLTGYHTKDQLKEKKANHIFENLKDKRILNLIKKI
ncbi:MAG: HAD family hydrolase [Candidatus Pacearchaeota archaeon]|nr:HAD family hydrolase [Candidatus Pacearchaeota archaeon]